MYVPQSNRMPRRNSVVNRVAANPVKTAMSARSNTVPRARTRSAVAPFYTGPSSQGPGFGPPPADFGADYYGAPWAPTGMAQLAVPMPRLPRAGSRPGAINTAAGSRRQMRAMAYRLSAPFTRDLPRGINYPFTGGPPDVYASPTSGITMVGGQNWNQGQQVNVPPFSAYPNSADQMHLYQTFGFNPWLKLGPQGGNLTF